MNAEDSVTVAVETITPQVAAALLASNPNNRNLRVRQVDKWSRALQANEWQLNGESLKVSKSGQLLDGQHRLRACVGTGISMRVVVVRGLAENVMATVDVGSPRNMGDVLRLMGIENNRNLAAALSRLWMVRQDTWTNGIVSSLELLDLLDEEKFIIDSVKPGQNAWTVLGGSNAGLIVFDYLARQADGNEAVDAFWPRVMDGANLSSDDARLALRKNFSNAHGMKKRLTSKQQMGLLLKSYAYWKSGKTVAYLRFAENEELMLP